jgi:cytidylate kinase
VIITIDGPAGTGKSTVAHRLARRLGLDFLDTGALSRAAALVALEQGIEPADGPAVAAAIAALRLHFDFTSDPPRIMLGRRDVSRRIRDLDVTRIVSIVAAQGALRRVLVEQQRRIAAEHPRLVSEGRDQGSVVFPDATLRFYLDAAPEVRAQRRLEQLAAAGIEADLERIEREIRERDTLDSTRADGPLVRPAGAVELDTGILTADEVVDRLEAVARRRIPQLEFAS